MLDRAAITVACSRLAVCLGAVLTGLLALLSMVRAPAPVAEPCSMMSSAEHSRAVIQTRTRELNPRYFTRSRFAEPMLAR